MRIIIQIDQNSRRKDRGDGIVYFDYDSFQFPEKEWFDFTILVIAGWNASIFEMLKCKNDSCILSFVDGRWAVRMTRVGTQCILEFGIYDSFDKVFEKSENTTITSDFKDFWDELKRVNSEIITYAEQNSLDSDYFVSMETWYNKLVQLTAPE